MFIIIYLSESETFYLLDKTSLSECNMKITVELVNKIDTIHVSKLNAGSWEIVELGRTIIQHETTPQWSNSPFQLPFGGKFKSNHCHLRYRVIHRFSAFLYMQFLNRVIAPGLWMTANLSFIGSFFVMLYIQWLFKDIF